MEEAISLDEFEVEERPEKEAFVVDDLNKATWAMRQLRGVVAQLEANAAIAEEEKKRIDAWLEHANKNLLSDRAFFEAHLTAYLRKEREENPTKKSISTPYGKIVSRTSQPKWETQEELVDWLLNNKDTLIRVKYEVDKAELKKTFEADGSKAINPETGEVVPFIHIVPSEITYKVEVEL